MGTNYEQKNTLWTHCRNVCHDTLMVTVSEIKDQIARLRLIWWLPIRLILWGIQALLKKIYDKPVIIVGNPRR